MEDLDKSICIAPVKVLFLLKKLICYVSYFSMKTCCGYSLQAPHRGASNEYSQHIFLMEK